MEYYFWYKTCPTCFGQGRLFIVEDISNSRLYLHCEECETGYINPLELDPESSFSTLSPEFEHELVVFSTIEQYGWERFAANQIEISDAPKI